MHTAFALSSRALKTAKLTSRERRWYSVGVQSIQINANVSVKLHVLAARCVLHFWVFSLFSYVLCGICSLHIRLPLLHYSKCPVLGTIATNGIEFWLCISNMKIEACNVRKLSLKLLKFPAYCFHMNVGGWEVICAFHCNCTSFPCFSHLRFL